MRWSLKQGPGLNITLCVEAKSPDEDGSRAKFEATFTVDEARVLVDGLELAILGEWASAQ